MGTFIEKETSNTTKTLSMKDLNSLIQGFYGNLLALSSDFHQRRNLGRFALEFHTSWILDQETWCELILCR